MIVDSWTHGRSAYVSRGCRCERCRADNAAYTRELRQRLHQRPLPRDLVHGCGAYANWGCRCRTCRDANAAHVRQWRQARAR